MMYANVAVPAPLHKMFTYGVPSNLADRAKPGMRAVVSFHRRNVVGYIIELTKNAPSRGVAKDIIDIPDESPTFSPAMIKLISWMADYYCAPVGDCFRAASPVVLNRVPKETTGRKRTQLPGNIEDVLPTSEPEFTTGQTQALDKLRSGLNGGFHTTLLHGITGSGKTEIYLKLIDDMIKSGRQSILLVPEIGLTPQLLGNVKARFGDLASVYHSGLTDKNRLIEWQKMRKGETKVVVGTRSAVFAPFDRLGLIIVDEEHDSSYKQEESPRYQGRDTAIVRAKFEDVPVILGTATPAIETFHNAKTKKYSYIYLGTRATGAELPSVKIVDLKTERPSDRKAGSIFPALKGAIQETLDAKKQVMLFLNRRGYASFLLCKDCGFTPTCPNCDITLTYHLHGHNLVCHYCDYKIPGPDVCEKCGGTNVSPLGLGTQKIEEELLRLFPNARIGRLDRDISSKRGAGEDVLKKMRDGEIDILIGTQMITKGHDFPNVTLVGVIDSDVSLNIPDFRSSERTFQLLTQVAGRAGRAEHPGKVMIQTYTPDNHAIAHSQNHDYFAFYDSEIGHRGEVGYPPFSRLANLLIRGNDEKKVRAYAEALGSYLGRDAADGLTILGPVPALLKKVSGKYRWQILLKSVKVSTLSKALKKVIEHSDENAPAGVQIITDVDPSSTL